MYLIYQYLKAMRMKTMSNAKLDSFTYIQPFENDVACGSIGDMGKLKTAIANNLSAIENMVYRFGESTFTDEQHVKNLEDNFLNVMLVKGLFMYIQTKVKLENLTFNTLMFNSVIIPIDEKKSDFKVEVITIKEN